MDLYLAIPLLDLLYKRPLLNELGADAPSKWAVLNELAAMHPIQMLNMAVKMLLLTLFLFSAILQCKVDFTIDLYLLLDSVASGEITDCPVRFCNADRISRSVVCHCLSSIQNSIGQF